MRLALAACVLVFMGLPAAAQTKSVYTDINRCGGEDTQNDAFFHECKGPGGRTVSLLYEEGFARIVVDMDTSSPAAEVKIPVGARGKVFGDKIEWRVRQGKPCAVIARVNTDKGARLIVTSLGRPALIFAWDHTNQEARSTSETACDSVDKPYTPPGELPAEERGAWTVSGRCDEPSKVTIGPKTVTLTSPGNSIVYNKVDEAHTFLHGARYDGKESALLAFPDGSDKIETVIVLNADEQEDRIKIVDTSDAVKAKFRDIVEKPLRLCR